MTSTRHNMHDPTPDPYPGDLSAWERRVRELEAQGLDRSDAQAVVDAEAESDPSERER